MNKQLTTDNIKTVTSARIKLYKQYTEWADSGKPGVDGAESRFYLSMWQDIEQKQHQWSALSTQQQAEVVAAFYDYK